MNDRDHRLLSAVTRAVLVAGSVAGAVALVLGGLLVRQITKPLAGLITASGQIARGDFSVRVAVASRDELGTLATTFNYMADSLETQERLRRHLVADVAHELRTPLTAIQGTVEALQDGVFALTKENLAPIHQEVTLLNRLVEDLRTLANAEAGSLTLEERPLQPAAFVKGQIAAFQVQAASQGVTLVTQVADPLPMIHGDEQRLGQVLNNLLSNALRHTAAPGEITVCVRAVERGAAYGVQITVRDTGEGIPAADLPHVFDRFYRIDNSRSRTTGGSGLGLAIARQLVELHGGSIWAISPPEGSPQGSEFALFLPGNGRV